MRRFLSSFSWFFVALFLAGCAATQLTPPTAPGAKKVQGLFAVITPETNQSGHFNWVQQGQDFTLLLYGPLGLGATSLSQTGQEVVLTASNGKTYRAQSAEALLNDVIGWSMPVSGFVYWLFAAPDPAYPFTATRDNTGRILTLQQEGWAITYTWADSGNQLQGMILLRDGIKIKLFFNN